MIRAEAHDGTPQANGQANHPDPDGISSLN